MHTATFARHGGHATVVHAVEAPEIVGDGAWINTARRRLTLQGLRGKVVVLDFWTSCCINCLHILDELRPIEERFPDDVVVIGIHSPKFTHEADEQAVRDAVSRYDIVHPVFNDPGLKNWRSYNVQAWPTVVVIDQDGQIALQVAGEGHGESILETVERLLLDRSSTASSDAAAKGGATQGDPVDTSSLPDTGTLHFPSKAIATCHPRFDRALLVTDVGHHRIAVLDPDTLHVVASIGSGQRGRNDGDWSSASFHSPEGICDLPPDIAQIVGYDVLVADTANHLLRGVSLTEGSVRTVAGTGQPARLGQGEGPANERDLASPWDVLWWPALHKVVIASAGLHQLWTFDPLSGVVAWLAGDGREALTDGPASTASLAQPSGLALSGDGAGLWFVDAETSALRELRRGEVRTVVGKGLFDFGHVDGPTSTARLQHPLGLAVLSEGEVLVADTYNHAVRIIDPTTSSVRTVASDLREVSDVCLDGQTAWAVISSEHRLASIDLGGAAMLVTGDAHTIVRDETSVAPGTVVLTVVFQPGVGEKLDMTFGSPVQLRVDADPFDLLVDGAGDSTQLDRVLDIRPGARSGVLSVTARVATCDLDGEHPACHLAVQDWGIPIRVEEGGLSHLELVFRETTR